MGAPERIQHNPALVPPLAPAKPGQASGEPARTADGKTFEEVLRGRVSDTVGLRSVETAPAQAEGTLKFSAHAMARLRQRGIEFTSDQLQRLETAVDKLSAKGARDALVMLDDTAMVTSVTNRTVITALGMHQAKENVFTNIDSAVIA